MSRRTVRLLLVDDQTLFREGLRALLASQPDLEVVGEAGVKRECGDEPCGRKNDAQTK